MDAEKQPPPETPPQPHPFMHSKINSLFMLPVLVIGIFIGAVLPLAHPKLDAVSLFAKPTPTPLPTKTPSPTQEPTETPLPTPTPFKVGILTFPTANATLCNGQNYPIAWLVPPDTQIVGLTILPKDGKEHTIVTATNPGSENDPNSMKGTYIWRAGQNNDGAWLPSGPGYRLGIIVSGSGNASYENYGNYFTLSDCQE